MVLSDKAMRGLPGHLPVRHQILFNRACLVHWQPNPLCHVIQITHDNIDLRVDINLEKTFDGHMQLFKIYFREKLQHVFGTKTLNI